MIIEFDPTIEALHAIVEKTKNITATDLEDKSQLDFVKRNRIDIGKARIAIEKKGKELRADALKFQKDVIAKEKELLDIITPEEDRLKQIEKDAEAYQLKKEREAQLPDRIAKLEEHGVDMEEAEILSLNDNEFALKVANLIAQNNENARKKLEEDQAKLEEEKRIAEQKKLDDEQAEKDRLAKIEQDEADRVARIKKEDEEREARIKAEDEERARKEAKRLQDIEDEKNRIAREDEIKKQAEADALKKIEDDKKFEEARLEAERIEREKNEAITVFKSEYEFDKEEVIDGELVLWKKVASYKLN